MERIPNIETPEQSLEFLRSQGMRLDATISTLEIHEKSALYEKVCDEMARRLLARAAEMV